MIRVSHNLNRLSNEITNIPNDIQEAISRTFTDSLDLLKSNLELEFGNAIRYANFNISFQGMSYSINITDLNEFVTLAETGSNASDIALYAESFMSEKILEAINSARIGKL